jgi:hypothetical protein
MKAEKYSTLEVHVLFSSYLFIYLLVIESRAWLLLGEPSLTELHPHPTYYFINVSVNTSAWLGR